MHDQFSPTSRIGATTGGNPRPERLPHPIDTNDKLPGELAAEIGIAIIHQALQLATLQFTAFDRVNSIVC